LPKLPVPAVLSRPALRKITDEYKGEYAIEDTRHALIEAKMAGIHPFCITIDRHAHEST
jgi:nitric oxide reductase activation protein